MNRWKMHSLVGFFGFCFGGVSLFGATADSFKCTTLFSSNLFAPVGVQLHVAGIRIPEGLSLAGDIATTRGLITAHVDLPNSHSSAEFELEYKHAVLLDTAGSPIQAAQSVCLRPGLSMPSGSSQTVCLDTPISFNPIPFGWTPVELVNGIPVFSTARPLKLKKIGEDGGTFEIECLHVRTIP